MAINLRGVFLVTRKALALMLPGPGSIINIASIAGLRRYWPGFPSLAINYSTSKAGVIGFTRQVAAEYAKEKIRVNAVAPGWHGGTRWAPRAGRASGRTKSRRLRRRSRNAFRWGIAARRTISSGSLFT
jgi:NAD(P)-dependent dehydrogenase (short-subunit alcohol dehydrogenase family)